MPHFNRRVTARMLGLSEHQIHMPETDAGGSFGIRGEFYPEDLLVPLLAMRTGRPVKWVEDRVEHLTAANHAREQIHSFELSFDAGYRLTGMRGEAWLDTGGYIRTHGAVVPVLTAAMFGGPYRVPTFRSRVHIVTTNKTPVGTYRAPGRFQNNFVREHALDVAADRLGIDPVELRRINLMTAAELPAHRPMRIFGAPMFLDGADHHGHFDRRRGGACGSATTARWPGAGTRAGWSAPAGRDPGEGRPRPAGERRRHGGRGRGGQRISGGTRRSGHRDGDGTDRGRRVRDPQTPSRWFSETTSDAGRHGGSFASRSTVVGGTAVKMAAEQAVAKARRVAAGSCSTSRRRRLVVQHGGFQVGDAGRR